MTSIEGTDHTWKQIVVAEVAAMIPSLAALTRWQFLNPALVDGLLQAVSEVRGLDPDRQTLGELEWQLLDVFFPHQVELTKGPWLDDLADFIRRNGMEGLCAVYLLPFDDTEADVFRMVFHYRVCFSDQTDAALFRLNFG